MNEPDYYEILGVPRDASPEEIRYAYFEAAKRLHPDANPTSLARDAFLRLQAAYEVLNSAKKREVYDAGLPQSLISGSVAINMKFSRSALPWIQEPQLVYGLMEIISTAQQTEDQMQPVHLCLVVDRSTSMQGERMDMVKGNISHMLRRLRSKDFLSVVTFSDRASVLIPPTSVVDVERLDDEISQIVTGGGTELFQGLQAGVTQLRLTRSKNMIRQLILLTDGHSYGDESACYDLAQQLAKEGIIVNAMGIGSEWNDTFLDRMSGMTGGNASFATAKDDLARFLDQKLRSIENVYAKNLTFRFSSDENVQPHFIFRIYPETGPIDSSQAISLGNLVFGRSIVILFEFLVQPLVRPTGRLRLAFGNLEMEVVGQGNVLQYLNFYRPVVIDPENEAPPSSIVEAMSRMTLYRLQEKARTELRDGDANTASKRLQYLATHLLSQGDRELAHTVLVEAENIRQSHRFSKDGDKRIKYGTRALLLGAGMGNHEL